MQKKRFFITIVLFLVFGNCFSIEQKTPEKYFEDGYVHLAHREYGEALINFDLFIETEKIKKSPRKVKIATMHRYRAHCFEQLKLTEQAILENQKAMEIYTLLNDSAQISGCLQKLGALFNSEGKLEQASYFINEATLFFVKLKWVSKLQTSYFLQGEINFRMGKLVEARNNFELSLGVNTKFNVVSENTYLEGETWFYLAKITNTENFIDESKEYLEKAEKKFEYYVNELPEYYNQWIDLLLYKAIQLIAENEKAAYKEIEKAEYFAHEYNLSYPIERIQLAKAEYYDKVGYFEKAGNIYSSIFNENSRKTKLFYSEYIFALCNHYELMFSVDSNIIYLEKEYKLLEDFLVDSEEVLCEYSILRDRATSGKKNKILYDKFIKTSFQLYSSTKKTEYPEKAFLFAEMFTQGEKQKNYQLNLSENQLVEKAQIVLTINNLLSDIDSNEESSDKKQNELIQQINKLEKINIRGQNKVSEKEKVFTEYSVSALQKFLSDKDIYMKYFETDSDIFQFLISNESFQFYKIQKTNKYLDAENLFKKFISEPGTQVDLNNILYFTDAAYFLYQKFVPNLENSDLIIDWPNSNGKIIFEALLTSPAIPQSVNMKKLPFLIKERNVSYSGSSELFIETHKREYGDQPMNYVGFAPFSEKGFGRKQMLNFSGKEVKEIVRLVGGRSFIGKKATKSNLEKFASETTILHLSTHAGNHAIHPQLAELNFSTSEKGQFEKLFFYEIENGEWNNRLLILGACETSYGEHIANYGTVSLSNAFQLAGVQCVIGANWQANDFVSSKLTVATINNIKQGMETSEALRKAKIGIINSNNDLFSHPYYWAVYTFQGSKQFISLQKKGFNLYYYLLIVAGILFGFYFFMKFLSHWEISRRRAN